MRQKTDAENADDLVRLIIGPERNAKVIIDPSAASFKAELEKRGIWHVDADNAVDAGIRRVSMVLNKRRAGYCGGVAGDVGDNGIYQGCPHGIQEMQTYSWDVKAAQRGVEQP